MNVYHFQIYRNFGETHPYARVKITSDSPREDVLDRLRRAYPGHQIYSCAPEYAAGGRAIPIMKIL